MANFFRLLKLLILITSLGFFRIGWANDPLGQILGQVVAQGLSQALAPVFGRLFFGPCEMHSLKPVGEEGATYQYPEHQKVKVSLKVEEFCGNYFQIHIKIENHSSTSVSFKQKSFVDLSTKPGFKYNSTKAIYEISEKSGKIPLPLIEFSVRQTPVWTEIPAGSSKVFQADFEHIDTGVSDFQKFEVGFQIHDLYVGSDKIFFERIFFSQAVNY